MDSHAPRAVGRDAFSARMNSSLSSSASATFAVHPSSRCSRASVRDASIPPPGDSTSVARIAPFRTRSNSDGLLTRTSGPSAARRSCRPRSTSPSPGAAPVCSRPRTSRVFLGAAGTTRLRCGTSASTSWEAIRSNSASASPSVLAPPSARRASSRPRRSAVSPSRPRVPLAARCQCVLQHVRPTDWRRTATLFCGLRYTVRARSALRRPHDASSASLNPGSSILNPPSPIPATFHQWRAGADTPPSAP